MGLRWGWRRGVVDQWKQCWKDQCLSTDVGLRMCTCVVTTLVNKITGQHLLSGLQWCSCDDNISCQAYSGVPVMRSKKHEYETSALGFHQNTMTSHTRASFPTVDTWSFVHTHETHDNPPTESLSLDSPGVSATTFSRPLKNTTGLIVLETTMSVY